MKSIKPGRSPSMLGGVVSIAAGIFGVIWICMTISIGGGAFALFGVVFIFIAIAQAVYHFKNATGKNRYSAYDIVDSDEEPDPLNQKYHTQEVKEEGHKKGAFCPYCGEPVEGDYAYCNRCGKKLP